MVFINSPGKWEKIHSFLCNPISRATLDVIESFSIKHLYGSQNKFRSLISVIVIDTVEFHNGYKYRRKPRYAKRRMRR